MYSCRPCDLNSSECSDGQYSGRFCRIFNDLSRCLKCDPSIEPGLSNGCLDEDSPYCVDGECSPCDPVANEGCEGGDDVPPICARQDVGALCVACVNDTECVRKNGTYCDEMSGQCLKCPENPRVGDMVPDGCPQPAPCVAGDCMEPTPFCVAQFGDCRQCDPFSENSERYSCDVSGDSPVCVDGSCDRCESNEQCRLHPNSRPLCRNGQCLLCDPVNHAGCGSPSRPRCAADGSRCVQCRQDGDCEAGLSCNVESGFCSCNNNAQCFALSPDRPVCREGANGVNECQACTVDEDVVDDMNRRNDCLDVEECATSSRCQFCLKPEFDKPMQAGPAIMVNPDAEENGNPKPGPNDEGSESNYGCLEDGETPICTQGRCRACAADADCFTRPGNRDVCREGLCVPCQEGDPDGCSLLIRAFAASLAPELSNPNARLEVTCQASGETLTLNGSSIPGQQPVTGDLFCPSGSEISICCTDGPSCSEPVPVDRANDDWVVRALQTLNLSPTTCPDQSAPPNTNRIDCRGRIRDQAIPVVGVGARRRGISCGLMLESRNVYAFESASIPINSAPTRRFA